MSTQTRLTQHKLYRNQAKSFTNFVKIPKSSHYVKVQTHVMSSPVITQTTKTQENEKSAVSNIPFSFQTRFVPVLTDNSQNPRFVQEFQFFINNNIVKFTSVATALPDKLDDAFQSQMQTCQPYLHHFSFDFQNNENNNINNNNIIDGVFERSESREEAKVAETVDFSSDRSPKDCTCDPNYSSYYRRVFGSQQGQGHPKQEGRNGGISLTGNFESLPRLEEELPAPLPNLLLPEESRKETAEAGPKIFRIIKKKIWKRKAAA